MVDKILRRARELVARGWTQGREARRADGEPVPPWSHDAVRWCAVGAIRRASNELTGNDRVEPIEAATRALRAALQGSGSVTLWNDAYNRSQAEVLALFDQALGSAAPE